MDDDADRVASRRLHALAKRMAEAERLAELETEWQYQPNEEIAHAAR